MAVWKEVESKGVRWLVSSDGEVKSPAHFSTYSRVRNGKMQEFSASFKERTLTPYKSKTGYLEVSLMTSGKRIKHTLHRLVGIAFVAGYADDLTINHKDGDKLNNRPENLEWVSLSRNTQHQWEIGLIDQRGDSHPAAKLTSKRVVYIRRLLAKGINAHTLAIVAGISPTVIDKIRDGRAWPTVTARSRVSIDA